MLNASWTDLATDVPCPDRMPRENTSSETLVKMMVEYVTLDTGRLRRKSGRNMARRITAPSARIGHEIFVLIGIIQLNVALGWKGSSGTTPFSGHGSVSVRSACNLEGKKPKERELLPGPQLNHLNRHTLMFLLIILLISQWR